MDSLGRQFQKIFVLIVIGSCLGCCNRHGSNQYYQTSHAAIDLASHDFKSNPVAVLSGSWRQLPMLRANSEHRQKAARFSDPNTDFRKRFWYFDLASPGENERILMTFTLPEERPPLILQLPASSAINAIQLLSATTSEVIFQHLKQADQFMDAISIPIPESAGARFHLVLTANTRKLRVSHEIFQLVVHTEDSKIGVSQANEFAGLTLGALLILLIYFLCIIRLAELRELAKLGIVTSILIALLLPIQADSILPVTFAKLPSFPWLLRFQSIISIYCTVVFLKLIGLPLWKFQSRNTSLLFYALPLFLLVPLGLTAAISLYLPIVFIAWIAYFIALSLHKRAEAKEQALLITAIAAGLFADFLRAETISSLPITSAQGFLIALCFHSARTMQQLLKNWTLRQKRLRLKADYLAHIFAQVRHDLAKGLLSQPYQGINSKPDLSHLQRKLAESYRHLNQVALHIEKAEATLHRDPIVPDRNWQQISMQEIFNDSVSTIQELIRQYPFFHLNASHSWQEQIPHIVSDRLLLNFVIHDLLSNMLKCSSKDSDSVVDLNMHYASDHRLFFITITLTQKSETTKTRDSSSALWQHDTQTAEENFNLCLEFNQRILSNISGKLHFKKPSFQQKFLELELPVLHPSSILKLSKMARPISRNLLQILPQAANPTGRQATENSQPTSLPVPAVMFGESSVFFSNLQSKLEHLGIKLSWCQHLAQLQVQANDRPISLVFIYFEQDHATVIRMLKQLRSEPDLGSLPIVIITTNHNSSYHLQMLPYHIDDYIQLPVSSDELLMRVQRTLERQKTITHLQDMKEQKALSNDFHQIFLPKQDILAGLHIESQYLGAAITGGDWFQTFYDKRNHRYFAVVGDVAGKGRKSALIASAANGAFQALTLGMSRRSQNLSLDRCLWELIEGINLAIFEAASRSQRTMTMTFIAIDLTTGDALYSNAGHGPIFVIHGDQIEPMLIGGRPLGLARDINLNYRRFQLSPESAIFIATDGLLKNQGPNGQSISQRQLVHMLSEEGKKGSTQIAESVLANAKSVWGNSTLVDDVAILVIYWSHATNPMQFDGLSA